VKLLMYFVTAATAISPGACGGCFPRSCLATVVQDRQSLCTHCTSVAAAFARGACGGCFLRSCLPSVVQGCQSLSVCLLCSPRLNHLLPVLQAVPFAALSDRGRHAQDVKSSLCLAAVASRAVSLPHHGRRKVRMSLVPVLLPTSEPPKLLPTATLPQPSQQSALAVRRHRSDAPSLAAASRCAHVAS